MVRNILITLILLTSFLSAEARERGHAQLRDSIVTFSQKYIGCKYAYANKGPKTFDCSGFTYFVFNHFNYTLSSSSATQYTQGEKIKLSKAQKGDLIFFKGSNANSNNVGHVGMITDVLGGDTVQFIHAAVKGGVRLDTYPGYTYYNIRFVGCRRIIDEIDIEVPETKEPDSEQEPALTIIDKTDTIPTVKEDPITQEEEIKKEEEISRKEEKPEVEKVVKKEKRKEKKEKKKKANNTQKREDSTITHIVKKGETLYRLSIQYGCTVDEIQKWNSLKGTTLKIGQEIIIKRRNIK